MDNRPHSRQKKIVDRAVKVEKKRIDKTVKNTGTSIVKNIISSLIRK